MKIENMWQKGKFGKFKIDEGFLRYKTDADCLQSYVNACIDALYNCEQEIFLKQFAETSTEGLKKLIEMAEKALKDKCEK